MEGLITLLNEFHMVYEEHYNLYLPSGRKEIYSIDILRNDKWYRVTYEDPNYYLAPRETDPEGRLGYPDTDYLFIDLLNNNFL